MGSARDTTGDLAFLNDSWSSSLSRFAETFAVTLDILKAFDRVWHKALLSKIPSFDFYPALCSLLSSFLSGRSIAAVVDGHCSTSQPITSGVPQGSVLSPTLFLLFIHDLLSLTSCPFYSYADDTTLYYFTSFDRQPNLQELQISRNDAAECLTSDLSIISDWGRRNLVSLNASKTQFLHLSTQQNLPYNYPLFFNNTQLSPSLIPNSLGVSFTQNLNWKFCISSIHILTPATQERPMPWPRTADNHPWAVRATICHPSHIRGWPWHMIMLSIITELCQKWNYKR